MDMQDVDYELEYEPGKDEADPMDYLSRHPLPGTERDNTEQVIRQVIEAEHAVILPNIVNKTRKDKILQDVIDRIQNNDWEKYKRRPEILPFYMVRDELSVCEGLLLRGNQIVMPERLRRGLVMAAHNFGHFGKTRTNQMLGSKYWFPAMNAMVEELIDKCVNCQITTKEHRKEVIKPSEIPDEPWDTVSVDFCGPFPDGHYNLVVIDKRTRYPEVEQVYSISFRSTARKLRKIISTHGVPRRLESDSGPPNQNRSKTLPKKWGSNIKKLHHIILEPMEKLRVL